MTLPYIPDSSLRRLLLQRVQPFLYFPDFLANKRSQVAHVGIELHDTTFNSHEPLVHRVHPLVHHAQPTLDGKEFLHDLAEQFVCSIQPVSLRIHGLQYTTPRSGTEPPHPNTATITPHPSPFHGEHLQTPPNREGVNTLPYMFSGKRLHTWKRGLRRLDVTHNT